MSTVHDPPDRSAGGRLAVLSALAIGAHAIPVPFLPDRVIFQVRGAVVHDVTTRRGKSLTADARRTLAEPDSSHRAYAVARKAATALVQSFLKRIGPLGALRPTVRGLEVFALGHLLDRYLVEIRRTSNVRIQGDEAARIRDVIDRAVVRAASPALAPAVAHLPGPTEDLRDEFTRWLDALLLTGATLPSYLTRRLDAAFDEVAASTPDLR